ncbi:hypothetical protein ACGH7X_20260 [Streptomyces sp. BBFR51]
MPASQAGRSGRARRARQARRMEENTAAGSIVLTAEDLTDLG